MAATTGNAIKALVESRLSLAAYRDTAPPNEPLPFATVHDGIVITPDGREDGGVDNNVSTETVQVDLWEAWRDIGGDNAESPTLAGDVVRVLHGARLDLAPNRVYGITVVSHRRLLEPDSTDTRTYRGLVHTAITATVNRAL